MRNAVLALEGTVCTLITTKKENPVLSMRLQKLQPHHVHPTRCKTLKPSPSTNTDVVK